MTGGHWPPSRLGLGVTSAGGGGAGGSPAGAREGCWLDAPVAAVRTVKPGRWSAGTPGGASASLEEVGVVALLPDCGGCVIVGGAIVGAGMRLTPGRDRTVMPGGTRASVSWSPDGAAVDAGCGWTECRVPPDDEAGCADEGRPVAGDGSGVAGAEIRVTPGRCKTRTPRGTRASV